jgi:hypothetical protein
MRSNSRDSKRKFKPEEIINIDFLFALTSGPNVSQCSLPCSYTVRYSSCCYSNYDEKRRGMLDLFDVLFRIFLTLL